MRSVLEIKSCSFGYKLGHFYLTHIQDVLRKVGPSSTLSTTKNQDIKECEKSAVNVRNKNESRGRPLPSEKVAIDIVSKVSKRVVSWGETLLHTGPATIFVKVTNCRSLVDC